ncbi:MULTISPECIES: OprD family porin [unclassified Burkholderia]|uniref:OprD family porin n=1 Tax=unclassified Burkholderia TaxID=2613784 RepID=UPI00075EECB0|nr:MULTISPECIES: OprD family porin [unclassified Burkholderia]KVN06651.1 porin [Burkholderia sp. MSMB1552]KWZ50126.1 porin [Burkholderia sp. MSMB1588]
MTQHRSMKRVARAVVLAWGLPMLTGVSISGAARADDAASAAPAQAPSAAMLVQQATTPNAIINADATQAVMPPEPVSSQAKSNGFIADSHFDVLLRNYADVLDSKGGPHRHAWIQGVMANFESGYTGGLIGFGVDASIYAALKLDGGAGGGNMVHIAKGGGGSNQLAWAFPGIYDVKARISNTVIKYGLQAVDNPFMEQHDNRALPPTFLGATIVSNEFKNVMLEAGSFTKTNARGHTTLTNLTTQYGGTRVDRFTYVGGTWDYSSTGSASFYAGQADDVWRQYYGSVKQSYGSPQAIKWTGFGNFYSTHDTGDARQGKIDNNAYSLSLAAQHGPHELLLGYQQVLGDQFFDYLNETNGIFLVDSMDVDYNAPHEKSLQLRYTFYGKEAGLPGFKAMVWGVTGWGADGSASAALDPTRSSIYWKDGAPVQGRHHEFGFIPSYTIQSGKLKDTKITFIAMWHVGSAHYSDSTNQEYRLVVNVPVKVF